MSMNTKYTCHKCHGFAASSFSTILRHIGAVHSWEPNFDVTCGIEGCPRIYTSYRSYRKHILKVHSNFLDGHNVDNDSSTNNTAFDEPDTPDMPDMPSSSNELLQESNKHSAALFILKAKEERGISQQAINGLIEDIYEVFEAQRDILRDEIKTHLEGLNCNSHIIQSVDQVVKNSRTALPFDGLQSQYLQQQYFKTHFTFVEPIERKLGQKTRVSTAGNEPRIQLQWDTVFDVPLLDSLKQQLNDEHILDEVLRGHMRDDNVLEDYCDGTHFRSHPLYSEEPQSLQIMLYYDELELCNPLGAAKKVHKIGVFYYQLGNLSPEYRSSLKSIHLVAIAKSSVINQYGVNVILEKFVEEIIELEKGVTLSLGSPPCEYNFYGTISLTCGDNLASYLLGGYKQLSSALRKCRFCLAVYEDMQKKFLAADFTPRDKETHKAHIHSLDGPLHDHMATTYGLVFESVLNTTSYFHTTEGLLPDIMHDILEGSLQHAVKELLKHLINEESYFSLSLLNEKIERFPFMQTDKENKPVTILSTTLSSTGDHSLKQKASRMWCLARLLPLMVGDFVPVDNERWKLFLTLLTIVDYVFAPRVTKDISSYLRALIRDHHADFRRLYPHSPITPKLHNMIHIPEWIERCGPMVRSWCMRYEAKHNYFKELAQKMKCFKNICKSLSYHHQYMVCYQTYGPQSLVQKVRIGKTTEAIPDELPYYSTLVQSQKLPTSCTMLSRVKWVQVKGSKYSVGSIVVLETGTFPTFGLIIDIIIAEVDNYLFICEVLKTCQFAFHFHAYLLEKEDVISLAIVTYKDLADYHVLSLYTHNQALYTVPKYCLDV